MQVADIDDDGAIAIAGIAMDHTIAAIKPATSTSASSNSQARCH
jgi:hypothetical protein